MPNPHRHPQHSVATKARWSDEWTERTEDGLYCDGFSVACAPDVNSATLSRNYGKVMRAGKSSHAVSPRLSLNGQYVRITVDPESPGRLHWYGVIIETEDIKAGLLGNENPSGRQTFQCRGLEYLLQRTVVDKSFVQLVEDEPEVEIARAIGFNLGGGRSDAEKRVANMAISPVDNKPVFAPEVGENALDWTASDIATYLLDSLGPKDSTGETQITFELEPTSTVILTQFKPVLHAEGKSVKELLDELIDRRRGMTWFLSVNEDTQAVQLKIATFNSLPITLPSGPLIIPNADQQELDLNGDNRIRAVQLAIDDASKFDRVVARGEPLGSCFTLGFNYGNLEKDWTDTLQTEYNESATVAPGYDDLPDKSDALQEYRVDDKFITVYRQFRLPPDWDGKADGELVCPDPAAGEFEDPKTTKFWYPGLRFENRLPLLCTGDYATVTTIAATDTPQFSRIEYRRPFAVVDVTAGEATRSYYLEHMPRSVTTDNELILQTGGRGWSCHVRMQDDGPGVLLDVHGAMQHTIALDEFTAADDSDLEPAELSWKDIYATVFLEFDQHAEAQWPEGFVALDKDTYKVLVLDVPGARLDYLAKKTIVGIDNEGQAILSNGGYVQDDRDLLKDIARSSYQWYGTERRAMQFTIHSLTTTLNLGTLITTIGGEIDPVQVNSVVSSLDFNLLSGTITARTAFAELDLRDQRRGA